MKSECSPFHRKIAASVLGDLDARERQELEEHLAVCPNCRSELAGYVEACDLMESAGDELAPRHFFVHPEERISNPLLLFRRMKPLWQAVSAGAAAMLLLVAVASISEFQVRSAPEGWAVSFGRGMDIAALKEDILKEAEARNLRSLDTWIREMRREIAESSAAGTQQQRDYMAAELSKLDAGLRRRIAIAEGDVRTDARDLVMDVYETVARQRAQDLSVVNLRFDAIEASNAIKAEQTNDILGTLLDVAELRLGPTGELK